MDGHLTPQEAEELCAQLERVLRDRLERRSADMRAAQVCISFNDKWTNLSTCSMRYGSMELNEVLSLPDNDFAARLQQVLQEAELSE
eukprot:CAMPEP_0118949188 /NCGR_PEP_ID=MMETSP1169-20130426/49197_1 /TAXON_ID=36882 /ORGANISM="Pyramimonas obovata, Strain CCMP722" /LENGTH=86 /DNA_ID=CAMNT_0006895767 /DNA_START=606 /DNA_END=866 /DNA_ORIENTATION=-